MKCRQVQEQLAAYTASLVQGDERLALQTHLAACQACRDRAAEFRALDDLLVSDRPRASEAFVTRVMTQVQAEAGVPGRRWADALEGIGPFVAWPVLIAVAALLLVGNLGNWLETVREASLDWNLAAQPELAALLVVGAAAVAGIALLTANRVAETLA